jgi:hypothetical protein
MSLVAGINISYLKIILILTRLERMFGTFCMHRVFLENDMKWVKAYEYFQK